MTLKDEAVQRLDALKAGKTAHIEADEILLRFLEQEGHPELIEAFLRAEERIGFWRA
jgi:hypothetical protein